MLKKPLFITIIFSLLFFSLNCSTKNSNDRSDITTTNILLELNTVEDVIKWSENNLYYKNVDKWDRAPDIESVIKDGYGDCKMLAGVISVLLDSVGQQNQFIVIKKQYWHMFNAYEIEGKWYVVNNAKLIDKIFHNHEEIKNYFGVNKFENVFNNYDDFQKWFNLYVYPRNS